MHTIYFFTPSIIYKNGKLTYNSVGLFPDISFLIYFLDCGGIRELHSWYTPLQDAILR